MLFESLSKGREKPYPESDIDLIIVADGLKPDIFERRMSKLKFKGRPMAIEDLWLTEEELMDGVNGGYCSMPYPMEFPSTIPEGF